MTSINPSATGINGVAQYTSVSGSDDATASQLSGLDLESAMMLVQSNRANLLETQLKNQISAVQDRNNQIAQLNQLINDLRIQRASGTDTEAWSKLGSDAASGAAMYERLKGAGVTMPTGNDTVNGSTTDNGNIYDAKQKTVDTWIEQLKGKIDSLNSTQQMDMIRLQSLTNKRNEAFEIMTNTIEKIQKTNDSIVGNIR